MNDHRRGESQNFSDAVIGDKEVEANSLNIRTRVSGELGAIPGDEVKQKLGDAIAIPITQLNTGCPISELVLSCRE